MQRANDHRECIFRRPSATRERVSREALLAKVLSAVRAFRERPTRLPASIAEARSFAWWPIGIDRSQPDLTDLAGRCSWSPALCFLQPLDQHDGRLRTVDEQRTREDEQNQGGDDDGKEQAIHQSQAMAACFVPRWLWVSECFALPKIQRRRVRPQTELGQGRYRTCAPPLERHAQTYRLPGRWLLPRRSGRGQRALRALGRSTTDPPKPFGLVVPGISLSG